MSKITERKNPNSSTQIPDKEPVEFDSLPVETRKEIIEKIEAVGVHYDKLIQQKNNENK